MVWQGSHSSGLLVLLGASTETVAKIEGLYPSNPDSQHCFRVCRVFACSPACKLQRVLVGPLGPRCSTVQLAWDLRWHENMPILRGQTFLVANYPTILLCELQTVLLPQKETGICGRRNSTKLVFDSRCIQCSRFEHLQEDEAIWGHSAEHQTRFEAILTS